jgi:uncharacterized protein YcaQ
VAPKRHLREASETEADDFLLLKSIRTAGFSKLNSANYVLHRDFTRRDADAWLDRKLAAGELVEVAVEGLTGRHVALAGDVPVLEALARGRVPRAWRPLESTTLDEVTFLSPLDPAIHNRLWTRRLWDFDYQWGVYNKVETRKYGYYDLPILWGDRLVGRADMKLDRATGNLQVLGLWHEDDAVARDPSFLAAYERGLERLRNLAAAEPGSA